MKQHTLAFLVGCTALIGLASPAQAQTVYRIVGPDGKVTFSDKPPANAEQGKVATTGVGAAAASPATGLPFELRPVVAKYPVTLYTSPKCAPCDAGRSFLSGRGVPFTERTVTTPEDNDYLQRMTGDNSLPYVTIGGQRIRGYSDQEWAQYLDAAGYPKSSILPASFRNAPATPLVAVQKPVAPEPKPVENTEPAAPAVPRPAAPNPSNPAGITF